MTPAAIMAAAIPLEDLIFLSVEDLPLTLPLLTMDSGERRVDLREEEAEFVSWDGRPVEFLESEVTEALRESWRLLVVVMITGGGTAELICARAANPFGWSG